MALRARIPATIQYDLIRRRESFDVIFTAPAYQGPAPMTPCALQRRYSQEDNLAMAMASAHPKFGFTLAACRPTIPQRLGI